MLVFLKENQPLFLFGSLAAACSLAAMTLGVSLAVTYTQTDLVLRLPTAILATGLALVGLLLVASGLILDSVAKARVEAKRLAYFRLSAVGTVQEEVHQRASFARGPAVPHVPWWKIRLAQVLRRAPRSRRWRCWQTRSNIRLVTTRGPDRLLPAGLLERSRLSR